MKNTKKKKSKKKISKVVFNKVAKVASLATTVVAGEMIATKNAEANVTIGSTSGSTLKATGASLIGSGNIEGIAIGTSSKVNGAYGIALGKDSTSVQEGAIAIGKDSNALNKSAISLGYNSKASGGQSVAIGGNIQNDRGAQATGDQSISIGGDTVASGSSSIAIGGDDLDAANRTVGSLYSSLTGAPLVGTGTDRWIQTKASGEASIAVGVQATSAGDLATAFGTKTKASGKFSTALGVGATSDGQGSIAIGGAASSVGATAIAIGTKVTTIGESASAIGYGSQANNKGSIAIGLNSKSGNTGSTEENTIAMGTNSQSLTANSVAIGTGSIGGSTGIGSSAVAIGNGASAKGSDGIALGSGSNANNMQNIAIGYKTETGKTQVAGSSNNTDIRNVSIGSEAGKGMGGKDNLFLGTSSGQTSNGDYNVAFGSGSGKSVTGSYNTAMGANAGIGVKNNNNVSIGADSGQNTDGLGNTAIGWQSGQAVKGNQNISMGYQSAKGLKGSSNTVIGNQAGIGGVEGDNNIIVGTNATRLYTTGGSLKVQNVVSLGTNSKAYTDNSMSIGSYSEATGKAAIAIGQGSKASKDNSMAIGNGTLANTANGDVALGSGSATKAVTAVSNATITPPSSKSITYGTFAGNNPQSAVSVGTAGNERQIQNVAAGQISATSTDAINGSQLFAVANELGKTWKANAGGNLSGSATSTQVMPGDEVQFVAGKNLEVEQNLATGSQKYTYSLKKDVDLGSTGSLKAGPVTINNNGIDAGNKKITNVAPGTADTDAANVSQVKAATTTVSSNDASVTVNKVQKSDGHYNYDLSVDTNKIAANTNLTYKANSGTGLTTTLANGLDFKDGDNTVATVGPNGEVKYSLNPTVAGINSITTNGGNTVINDNGITTPKVTINNAPTAGTDATNKDYVDSTKTKVTSNDSSVVVNKTTSGNQDIYDLSVDVTKLDAANKSLSNINNDGNKVISNIARKSVDVVAGTNIKDIVKNDVQNSDGTTTTTYTINANGAKVLAGDGVTVATGTPGSNNITDYTVSVKNTTLTAAPGSTTVTAGDNNSYAKAGDVATAITNVGKASKTTVTSNDSSVTVVSKVDSGDGHVNYDLSVDTSKVAANTNLTYKANSGTGLTTTLANGLDFKDGDNTKATVGPNGEVKYSLNPTVAGINSITTNGGNTVINDNGVTTPSLTLTNSTPLTSSTGGKVTVPAGTGNQAVTGQTVANAINKLGDNTINLKASDGNITTKQSLNKDGGLEFNITGSNGITTTASGDTINVTIAQSGLNTSTTGGKTTVTPVTGGNTYATAGDVATAIQNAVNNSGWNAVAGSTGTGTTSGSVSNKLITPGETVKLQAGDNLNVDQSGGTFTYSLKNDINVNSITAGNNKFDTSGLTISDAAGNKAITTPSGTTYTTAAGNTTVINPTGVVINKSAADPSKSVSLTDNGLDNGGNKITNVAAGVDPTDAVNVSQLDKAINKSTYNGPVVYTNAAGEKIVKVNGNYYKASDVDVNGNLLPGAVAINPSDIQHSLLNADGSTTNPSTLDNVGKGKISSSSKQAINGSQLNNLGTQLGLTVDPSGTGFSNPTFAGLKNVNGSTGAAPTTFKDAVDQTIAKVNEGIIYGADNNTAGTRQQLGSRLTVESGDFASGGVNYKGQNLETSYVSDGAGNGKIIVGITENPEFNSVKAKTFTADDGAGNTTVTNGQGTTITDAAGNKNVATAAGNTYTNAAGNTTTVNSSGVTINKSAADPSKSVSLTNSGLDNGGNRITNIAAGVAPTDAVNVSQLGNAVNNLTTAINASKSEVIGGTNTTVTSSTGSNGQIVYKVDADGTTVSGGSSFVSVTQGTKDANNITDYKVDLAQGTKDKLNSIGTGNIAAGDNNTVTGSTVHNYIQNNPLTYTDDNGTTVTRNLGQNLNIVGRATGPLTTGNIGVVAAGPDTLELRLAENIDLGPNGRVTMGKTVVNDDGIKITGGPSVTSSGIDAGGKKVTNIAEGDISPTSNDAVTGRQVYNAISAGAADKATRAELAGVNNNLTAGIAGVAAMANLPQINDSASNRFNIAVAGGAYKNGRAMALGFSGVSDGGRFVYRASASLNNKRDVAVGLGVGYQFGKRDVMPNELDRMKSMVALIEEQKDSYSRQLKQQLEQESRKNQENSELIRQLMQEVQELKNKSKKG